MMHMFVTDGTSTRTKSNGDLAVGGIIQLRTFQLVYMM